MFSSKISLKTPPQPDPRQEEKPVYLGMALLLTVCKKWRQSPMQPLAASTEHSNLANSLEALRCPLRPLPLTRSSCSPASHRLTPPARIKSAHPWESKSRRLTQKTTPALGFEDFYVGFRQVNKRRQGEEQSCQLGTVPAGTRAAGERWGGARLLKTGWT